MRFKFTCLWFFIYCMSKILWYQKGHNLKIIFFQKVPLYIDFEFFHALQLLFFVICSFLNVFFLLSDALLKDILLKIKITKTRKIARTTRAFLWYKKVLRGIPQNENETKSRTLNDSKHKKLPSKKD